MTNNEKLLLSEVSLDLMTIRLSLKAIISPLLSTGKNINMILDILDRNERKLNEVIDKE